MNVGQLLNNLLLTLKSIVRMLFVILVLNIFENEHAVGSMIKKNVT